MYFSRRGSKWYTAVVPGLTTILLLVGAALHSVALAPSPSTDAQISGSSRGEALGGAVYGVVSMSGGAGGARFAGTQSLRIDLDSQVYEEALERALEEEMPGILDEGEKNDVSRLSMVVREKDDLRVVISDSSGRVLLERTIPTEEGPIPAIRTLVLLARRAALATHGELPEAPVEEPPSGEAEGETPLGEPEDPLERRFRELVVPQAAEEPLDPERTEQVDAPLSEPEGQPEPSSRAVEEAEPSEEISFEPQVDGRLVMGASLLATMWRGPPTPQLGPAVSLEAVLPLAVDLRAGVRVALPGSLCCEPSTSAIEAAARETVVLAQLRVGLASWGGARAEVLGAAGMSRVVVDAEPSVFVGSVTPVRSSSGHAVLALGGSLTLDAAPHWLLSFELGSMARMGTHRVRLPDAWQEVDAPLESGRVVPWAAVRTGVRFF